MWISNTLGGQIQRWCFWVQRGMKCRYAVVWCVSMYDVLVLIESSSGLVFRRWDHGVVEFPWHWEGVGRGRRRATRRQWISATRGSLKTFSLILHVVVIAVMMCLLGNWHYVRSKYWGLKSFNYCIMIHKLFLLACSTQLSAAIQRATTFQFASENLLEPY